MFQFGWRVPVDFTPPWRSDGGCRLVPAAAGSVHNHCQSRTSHQQRSQSLIEKCQIVILFKQVHLFSIAVSLVIVCDNEPAEFHCETLKGKGLTSTIKLESQRDNAFAGQVSPISAGLDTHDSVHTSAVRVGLAHSSPSYAAWTANPSNFSHFNGS